MPNFVVPWDLRHHPALRDEDIAEILGDLNASRLSAALAAIARTAIFELQWDDDLATDVIEAILRHPKGERAGQVSARLQEIAADLEDEARGTRWGVVAGADGWEKADRLSRQAELVRLFGSLVEADDIDQAYAAVMPSVLDSVVRKQQARVIVLVNCVRHIATRGGVGGPGEARFFVCGRVEPYGLAVLGYWPGRCRSRQPARSGTPRSRR